MGSSSSLRERTAVLTHGAHSGTKHYSFAKEITIASDVCIIMANISAHSVCNYFVVQEGSSCTSTSPTPRGIAGKSGPTILQTKFLGICYCRNVCIIFPEYTHYYFSYSRPL